MTSEIEPRRPIPPAPVHPLAAITTVVLDNIFGIFELADPLAIVFTSLGVGLLGAVSTTLVQRYLAKDGWGASVAKGLVMGIIAGVPISVTGTAVGGVLLAWAGLHEWVRLPPPKGQTASGEEVVDAEVKDIGEIKKE